MSKLAFLFPGQGSQYAGMGRSLAQSYPLARQAFEEADAVLGFPLSRLCFEGPEEELRLTENTQPAIVATSVAAWRILEANGIRADYVAGHSLGEYSALVAARSLSYPDALRLVRKRGRFMQEAVPPGEGAMAALIKLPEQALEPILEQAAQGQVVSAANFNSPDQIVIAGHRAAVERAVELAKASGARKAVLLPVSAPFHCPLMRPAQQRMRQELEEVVFQELQIPLVNNFQAMLVHSGAQARQGLIEQIPNPVRWTESMRQLARLGVTRCIEVGPGRVLAGLMKSIVPEIRVLPFGEAADLEALREVAA